MQRDYKIDNIRAIAIMSVVLGHSMILYSNNWSLYSATKSSDFFCYLKSFIDIYQMPLFFSLSGYVFAMKWRNIDISSYVRNKIRRLIVPFLMVALLWMIPIKMLLHYPYYDGMSYQEVFISFIAGYHLGHLWYLPTLFFLSLLMFLIVKLFGNTNYTYVTIFLAAVLMYFLRDRSFSYKFIYINYIFQFAWSFAFGALIYRTYILYYIKPFTQIIIFTAILISAIHILTGRSNSIMVASFAVLSIFLTVPNVNYKATKNISDNSYGIYLFHSPLINIMFTYFLEAILIILVLVNFFVFGGVAYVMTSLIRKTPLKVIIGEQ